MTTEVSRGSCWKVSHFTLSSLITTGDREKWPVEAYQKGGRIMEVIPGFMLVFCSREEVEKIFIIGNQLWMYLDNSGVWSLETSFFSLTCLSSGWYLVSFTPQLVPGF